MKERIVRMALVAAAFGLWSTAADAGQERVVLRSQDEATGAEIRVLAGPAGSGFSIQAPDVLIERRVSNGRVFTTLEAGGREMTFEYRGGTLSLSENGRLVAEMGGGADPRPMREAARRTTILPAAVSLLGRVQVINSSSLRFAVATTQAMLQALLGQPAPAAELKLAADGLRHSVRLTRAAWQSSPSDCWDKYVKEAIAAVLEYEDCVKNLKWYDIAGDLACALIYDMRALGAFSWWINCIS
jgi:hypothetical protein